MNQAPGTLKLPDLEPPPTCPFILTNDVKEQKTDDKSLPIRGDQRLVFGNPRNEQPVRRCGEKPYMESAQIGQQPFLLFSGAASGKPRQQDAFTRP